MKFELKNEYIKKGDGAFTANPSPSIIVLPSGVYKIIINPMGKPVKKYKCDFLKEKMSCLLIQTSGAGIRVCGDILITMVEMGFDLASKDDWKRAKNIDNGKIVSEYLKILEGKPELFDEKKIELGKLEDEKERLEEEKHVEKERSKELLESKMKEWEKGPLFKNKRTRVIVKRITAILVIIFAYWYVTEGYLAVRVIWARWQLGAF